MDNGRIICPACGGMRQIHYGTYGDKDDPGYVNCSGCNGTGMCWKCGGSGAYVP